MKTIQNTGDYQLLDSGDGRKLEQFGDVTLSRPCDVAVWGKTLSSDIWDSADGTFTAGSDNTWTFSRSVPDNWLLSIGSLTFKLSLTPFGHVGIFPEQIHAWSWIADTIRSSGRKELSVLNLFAYSGGASLASAQAGASVCHLDASKGMTLRARENAEINNLSDAPVRWIVDDVNKFLKREEKRGKRYDAIILDPPSFGHGKSGEVFKIEESIDDLLELCSSLLTPEPLFVYLSCHTPFFTPVVLHDRLQAILARKTGNVSSGELYLTGRQGVRPIESGAYAIWLEAQAPGVPGR